MAKLVKSQKVVKLVEVVKPIEPIYKGESNLPYIEGNKVWRFGIESEIAKTLTLGQTSITLTLYHPVWEMPPYRVNLPNLTDSLTENIRQYQNILNQSLYLPLSLPESMSSGITFLSAKIPTPQWAKTLLEEVKKVNPSHNQRNGNIHQVTIDNVNYSLNSLSLYCMGISQSHINPKNGRVVGRYHPARLLDLLIDAGYVNLSIGDRSPMYANIIGKLNSVRAKIEQEKADKEKAEQIRIEQERIEKEKADKEKAKIEKAKAKRK